MAYTDRQCKCCDEEAQCQVIEEGFSKNRYKCTNCHKYFWADKKWMQGVKALKKGSWLAGIIITGGVVTYKLATGDPVGAVETLAYGIKGDDDNPIV